MNKLCSLQQQIQSFTQREKKNNLPKWIWLLFESAEMEVKFRFLWFIESLADYQDSIN